MNITKLWVCENVAEDQWVMSGFHEGVRLVIKPQEDWIGKVPLSVRGESLYVRWSFIYA